VVLNLGLLVVVRQLRVSQIGRVLFALREDHIAAEAIGIDGTRYRILAFGLSSLVAGVAGSFFAHYATYIAPTNFTTTESIAILTMMILGGMGTTLGPIVGSGLLTLLPEFLRIVASYRIVLYGLLLVLFALFRPQGIVGTKRPGARPAPFGPGGIAGTREPYAASRA
jgi:branched-chain amino acid transport system permease protein